MEVGVYALHSSLERGWLHFERLPFKHRANVHQSQHRRATDCLGINSDRDHSRVPSSDSLPIPPWFLMPITPCHLPRMVIPTLRDDNGVLGSWVALLGLDGRRPDELYRHILRRQRCFQSTCNLTIVLQPNSSDSQHAKHPRDSLSHLPDLQLCAMETQLEMASLFGALESTP